MHLLNDLRWRYQAFITPRNTSENIQNFRTLRPGWRFGEGVRPSEYIIETALTLNKTANDLGLYNTIATPRADGGIELLILRDIYDLEFIIEPDNSITYHKMSGIVDLEEELGLNLQQAIGKIYTFWEEICASSGYLGWRSISQNAVDSRVQRLAIQATDPAYPSLASTVFMSRTGVLANT